MWLNKAALSPPVVMALAMELCVLGNTLMKRPIPPLAERMHGMMVLMELQGRFIRSIDHIASPRGVALLPNGHLVRGHNDRLHIVNPSDPTFSRSIELGHRRFPQGVAALPNGHVVVSLCHGLQIVDPSDGTFIRYIDTRGDSGYNQWGSSGVAVLPSGHVSVCICNELQIVDPSDGTFIRSIGNGCGPAANQFHGPAGVAALPKWLCVISAIIDFKSWIPQTVPLFDRSAMGVGLMPINSMAQVM